MKRLTILLLFILPLLFACTGRENLEPTKDTEVRVESVSVSPISKDMTIGETVQLNATVSPGNATKKEISWSSSKSSVASVSSSGLVTALSEGTATITATADGKKGECTVSVVKATVAVKEIKLDKTELTLYEGAEETLTATVLPEDATDKSVTWSTSDKSIATVESGKVKAIKEGTATITASVGSFKAECKVSVLMKYAAVTITDLKPVEILPVVGQVTVGDKDVYNHIEHLRLVEATRIRDMMWEYGAGSHSKEAYQQLMGRLNAGMMSEYPRGYDNFEIMGGGQYGDEGGEHAHAEWSILSSLVNHAHLKVVFTGNGLFQNKLKAFLQENPNAIVIMGCSSYAEGSKKGFLEWAENEPVREMCKYGQLILFKSGGNVDVENGVLINKTYHRDINGDEHGMYSLQANANGISDPNADIALFVTIGTNDKGDSDQTGVTYSTSCFPVGFHDKALFAGRVFPIHNIRTDEIWAEQESIHSYQTSFTNYVNVAMMSICFQMYAEAKDVFELLDMVRSTCLTDYIRLDLNGDGDTNDIVEGQLESQPLQLINPAGLYKKYLTPQDLPSAISIGETLPLDKGYYKGVLFSIPGAEVKINGEWVAFDNKNKDLIFSQNPMTLEWRQNGDLLKRYGYTSGQTVEGQVITVDDKWGGLRLEVPMTIQLK